MSSLFYLTLAVLLILALWSYHPGDNAVLEGGSSAPLSNWVGGIGAWFSRTFFMLFGLAGWVIGFALLAMAIRGLIPQRVKRFRALLALLAVAVGAVLLFGMAPRAFIENSARLGLGDHSAPDSAITGGVIGQLLVAPAAEATVSGAAHPEGVLRHLLGPIGVTLIGWLFIFAGLILFYLAHWHRLINWHRVDGAGESFLDKIGGLMERSRKEPEPVLTAAAPAAPAVPLKAAPEVVKTQPPPAVIPPAVTAAEPPPVPPAPAPPPEPPEVTVPLRPEADVPGAVESDTASLDRLSFLQRTLAALNGDESSAPASVPASPPAAAAAPVQPAAAVPPSLPQSAPAMPATVLPPQHVTEANALPPPPEIPRSNGRNAAPPAFHLMTGTYVLPPISMLTKGESSVNEDAQYIEVAKARLQNTLDDFNVKGTVTGHLTGPQVTRYEISLDPGVPVSKVSAISNNILMNMETQSIRILAPIPGKNVVGVEVPNRKRETITLRSIFESDEWQLNKGEMPVVLGKNVSGKPVVTDLAKAPHLLIAGATGSGKSVCVNSLIMSLLFKFHPKDLRLILVDPKVVEFTFYQTLPFLITPVINDSNKALLALRWAVNEMEKRYRMLAKARTRNIKEYNSRNSQGQTVLGDDGEPLPESLPMLVIIVDEFADLMMGDRNVRKDVETAIARIAQKGRAAGIHIVLATQRPSRDVLTGIIKANLPTKIALRVGTQIDSRVIIDSVGAEDLLGYGDMLFLPPSSPMLERIQGTWVSNEEVEKIVDFISGQAQPEFNASVVADPDSEEEEEAPPARGRNGKNRGGGSYDEDDFDDYEEEAPDLNPIVAKYLQPDDDKLLREALEIILMEHQASTSYLQRRLKIGYNRAADLVDEFERRGIIGPPRDGGSKREILVFDEITKE